MRGPHCGGCLLPKLGATGFVEPRGKLTHGVLILGEAAGEHEAVQGEPFVGPSGQLLNKIISRTTDPDGGAPLRREDFLVGNILWCRPPGNALTGAPYEEEAITSCTPYLRKFLQETKPKAILALGNQPLRWLTGQWGIDSLRGYVFSTKWGPVVGTYHPSYIMRGKFALSRVVQLDLRRALYVARHGAPSEKKFYILYPTPMEVEKWVLSYEEALRGDPTLPLAFDIETPYGGKDEDFDVEGDDEVMDASYQILRISFSFKGMEAITFPWEPPYIDLAKRLLSGEGEKVAWNGDNFDVPRLQANGVIFGGTVVDAMMAWHYLEPALPMGLKYVATFFCPDMHAWKLEAHTNPAWYSAADSDVLFRCYEGIKGRLVELGRGDTFHRHFVQLGQVLRGMSSRGVLVDRTSRQEAKDSFDRRLEECIERVQPHVPLQVRRRKVFKLDEERLKKGGSWVEGKMIEVEEMAHLHLYVPLEEDPTMVGCSCGKMKKAPKVKVPRKRKEAKSAPKPRKRRKKDGEQGEGREGSGDAPEIPLHPGGPPAP